MFGAIVGDMIGRPFEFAGHKSLEFELFSEHSRTSDDSVLTVAVMDTLLLDNGSYRENYIRYGTAWPHKGYGGHFARWVNCEGNIEYSSWGNGSGMRVSPVGHAAQTLDDAIHMATESAMPTHSHPEGIKGAVAIAGSVFLAKQKSSKDDIRNWVTNHCGYNLNRTIESIRPTYNFEVSCQKSVPEAIIAFLDSSDFENAARLAVSLGGDADTVCAMTCSIAEPFYGGIPENILNLALPRIESEFMEVIAKFIAYLQK